MSLRAVLGLLWIALALSGCQTVSQTFDKVRETVRNVVTGSDRPADDGTACYAVERTAFYDAVGEVERNRTLFVGGQVAAGAAGVLGAILADSFETKMAALGVAAAAIALLEVVKQDYTRTDKVTRSFDSLMTCRRGEVQAIRRDQRAKTITGEEADRRIRALQALLRTDIEAARAANAILSDRLEGFEQSTGKARARARTVKNRAQRQKDQTEIKKAEGAVLTNRQAVNRQTTKINEAEKFTATLDKGIQKAFLAPVADPVPS